MKTLIKYFLSFFISALFFNAVLFASDSFHFSGSTQIQISKLKAEDGAVYNHVSLEGFFNGSQPGAPELPVEYINLIIPSDQTAVNARLISSIKQEYKLEEPLFPAQPDRPTTTREITIPFESPKSEIYQNTNPYPEKIVEIIKHNWFDGDKHIVTLGISPVKYFPKENKIILHTDIQYELEYSSGAKGAIHIKGRSDKYSAFYNELLKNIVSNPENVPTSSASEGLLKVSNGPLPFYEYVIITPNAFANSFNRFLDWKKRKGLNAGIVTVEDILNNYTTDHISGITDAAGAIRQYLYDAYTSGTTVYALMGGDYNYVPIRYGCGTHNTWDYHYSGGTIYDGYKIPADLYFCDFNGDWDVDGDVFTGESSDDNPDYAPEIFVGRLLCTSANDILNWTEKVILYEQNPGKGDISYLTRSFMISSDQLEHQPDSVDHHFPTTLTHTIWKELPSGGASYPTFPFGHEVITEMNTTRYALWSWFGHGSPRDVISKSHNWNDPPRSVVHIWDSMDSEVGNGLDNLQNSNNPALVYSLGCENMPFDDFNTNPGERNLGESFTSMFTGGGPAFLGNTRFGWVYSSYQLYQDFADLTDNGGNYLHLGIAESISKDNNSASKHYLAYSHNLVGCPETKMWVQTPSSFASVSVADGGSSITVDAGLSDCDISVCSIDGGQSYHLVANGVSSYTFTTNVRPLYVTISKNHYLPFIGITGGSITENHTLSGKIEIIDDLSIDNGKTLTIDPGTLIQFADDVCLTVNGTLNVNGTSNNNVVFTYANPSPAPSDWYGIKVYGSVNIDHSIIEYANRGIRFYQNSSGTVTNSEIKNNNYGIYSYKSNPTIQNCDIHNNGSRGIYFYGTNYISGSAQILNNNIYDNDDYGIVLAESSPDIRDNKIYNHDYGVSCYGFSSPFFGEYDFYGYNEIHDNEIGLEAFDLCNPFLGQENCVPDGGYNSFVSNNWHIWTAMDCYVMAEGNWWGCYPPNESEFYVAGDSEIDKTPSLQSAPGGNKMLAKSSGEASAFNSDFNQTHSNNSPVDKDFMSYYDPKWNIEQKLLFARNISHLGDIKNAQTICKEVMETYPDSSLSHFALDILWESSRDEKATEGYDLLAYNDYVQKLSANKEPKELYDHAAIVNAGFDTEKSVSTYDQVYTDNKGNSLSEVALYHKFIYYYNADDLETAKQITEQLEYEYPKSISLRKANSHFYEKSPEQEKIIAKQSISNTPGNYAISDNYPNPFNPSTTIDFAVPKNSHVVISIHNTLGQIVKKYTYNSISSGVHPFVWDGKNENGIDMSSGLYILHFSAQSLEGDKETFSKSIKILLVR
jgi:parallel beta-helix repeat protein